MVTIRSKEYNLIFYLFIYLFFYRSKKIFIFIFIMFGKKPHVNLLFIVILLLVFCLSLLQNSNLLW